MPTRLAPTSDRTQWATGTSARCLAAGASALGGRGSAAWAQGDAAGAAPAGEQQAAAGAAAGSSGVLPEQSQATAAQPGEGAVAPNVSRLPLAGEELSQEAAKKLLEVAVITFWC